MTATHNSVEMKPRLPTDFNPKAGRVIDQTKGISYTKTFHAEPQSGSWKGLAAGAIVPLGLAVAAVIVTWLSTYERVAISAWIAVTVVGSASVISAAVVSQRRSLSIDRSDQEEKPVVRIDDVRKTEPE